ncbi:MAG: hypothetical protein H6558_04610 [Lewinellaceae bacterium]|nr:hypothetical protein [Lewinellaceae bacterium]
MPFSKICLFSTILNTICFKNNDEPVFFQESCDGEEERGGGAAKGAVEK